ncbi:MAG: PE domain-containing protein [Mycobacterium sp.]
MYADTEGLHGVAGELAAAAEALSALAATPLTHPPLAVDEVSTSAATRISEHGAVLASRAADAAAVLRSAVRAIRESARAYSDMDTANISVVGLRGDPGSAGPVMTPAATVNMPTVQVPITPVPPRDGEVAAAMMEAGQPDLGAGFVAGCDAHAVAFRGCAVAARTAQTSVGEFLTGVAGPRIGAALGRFAGWADDMARHADTVAEFASGHKERFQTAQHNTPPTTAFATKRRELANAEALNVRTRGAYSGVVSRLQTELMGLHSRAGAASTSYHIGELPAAPPPPPPVVPVVGAGAASSPQHQPIARRDTNDPNGEQGRDTAVDGTDDASADPAGDDLTLPGDPAADPATGALGEASPMMAAMLPSVLAGTLGGLVGMAASIPQQIGQQVQSLASQAIQGVDGLTSAITEPETSEFDASGYDPSELAGDLAGGVVGGGDGTEPAAGSDTLPPNAGIMLTMGAPTSTAPPLVGQSSASAGVPSADAGLGGMPMFMPPTAGMGASGGSAARSVKEPDKTIQMPAEPNCEPVKGEVVRRDTAVADDPSGENKRKPPVSVSVSSNRRRIDVPKDGGGDDGV